MSDSRIFNYIWIAGIIVGLCLLATPNTLQAEGHFIPGLQSSRDNAAKATGYEFKLNSFYYSSDRYKNSDGDKVSSLPAGGSQFEPNVDIFGFIPSFSYRSNFKILGAKYGASIAPYFGTTSIGASTIVASSGVEPSDSNFGIGDLYFQPLLLVWGQKKGDFAFSYGVHAPVGEFDNNDRDNIGLGYWSNEIELTALGYWDENKVTAFSFMGTFEINSEQRGSDYRPGNNMAIELGISHKATEMIDFGVTAYHYWQVSGDKGGNILFPGRERTHGFGGRLAFHLDEGASVFLRFLTEVGARSRFEANLATVNISMPL